MKKQSGLIARSQKVRAAEQARLAEFSVQYVLDAAIFAASDVFCAGPKKAREFVSAFGEYLEEMSTAIQADARDDKDIVYAREIIDRRLLQIVGEENFDPWPVRYAGGDKK